LKAPIIYRIPILHMLSIMSEMCSCNQITPSGIVIAAAAVVKAKEQTMGQLIRKS
jgi:hypothetical protein